MAERRVYASWRRRRKWKALAMLFCWGRFAAGIAHRQGGDRTARRAKADRTVEVPHPRGPRQPRLGAGYRVAIDAGVDLPMSLSP